MQIIEITVSSDGSTRVETKGFAGANCRQASAFIEQALGRRTGEQLKSEFYTQSTQHQTQQEHQ